MIPFQIPKLLLPLLMVASLDLASSSCFADTAPPMHGGGAATRSVSMYLEAERGLFDQLSHKNIKELGAVLGDTFEMRSAHLADAVSKEDWLAAWSATELSSYYVRELSVREFGDTAVVSFLLDQKGTKGNKPVPALQYIVDIWDQKEHKLMVRYQSQPKHAVPATGRPSGKE